MTTGFITGRNVTFAGTGIAADAVEVEGGSGKFDGTISDGAISGALQKAGTGTLTLTASNSYSGGTTIEGGTLDLAAASSAGTGAITFAPTSGSSAALDL